MRNFSLIFGICFILISCGDSKQAQLENIKNACLEMGSTTIGFGGPSERMKILKSYGFSASIGASVNSSISSNNELARGWSWKPETESCINRAFDCPAFLGITLLDGKPEELKAAGTKFATNYENTIKECMFG